MTNRIHESNGRVPTAGPLEAASRAERRLISQMDELSKRLDGLATTDLAAAQERLALAAANLAERVEAAKTFVDATIARVGNLLDGLADIWSDDVTKADEVITPPITQQEWDEQVPPLNRLAERTPPVMRPLTPGELEAVAQAPWRDADKAVHDDVANEYNHRHGESHTTAGPPDDEDDPEDDLPDEDDEYCPVKADVEWSKESNEMVERSPLVTEEQWKAASNPPVTEDDFDADNYLPPEVKEAAAEAIRREEENEAVALKTADVKGEAFNVHLKDAFDQSNRNLDAPKKPARRRGRKT